jgi:hypothetical protein
MIGQLGELHYLRKANALFYEFEEGGMNEQLGYSSPADFADRYPQFYWKHFGKRPDGDPPPQCHFERTAVDCKSIQQLFRAERELSLSGLQR